MNLPVVLHKEREVVYRGLRSEWRGIADAAAERSVFAQHLDGVIGYLALIRGMRPGVSEDRQMPAGMFDRPQMKVWDHW